MTYETTTTGSEATQSLAAKLAPALMGGEVIELSSDLGGGKTTFTQGLVSALSYNGRVTSPTFTLSNSYDLANGRAVHHYDLYRLNEGGVVGDELAEDMADPGVITVVEWAGIMDAGLPVDRLRVTIEVTGEDERHVTFTSGGPVSERLVKAVAT